MKGRILLAAVLLLLMASFRYSQQPWPVPDKAAKNPNPLKGDKASLAGGKSLWNQHCSSCHGKMGKGDGSKAAQLKTPLVDFGTAEVQSQTDGALFYKISEGRNEMPSYKKKIPDADEIWGLVNYIRTFKK